METAQKMVDEAAKRAGYNSPKVYHGSSEKFTEFSYDKIGSSTGVSILGEGFYFTDKKQLGEGYGDKLYEVYLKLRNPYVASADDAYTLNASVLENQGYDGVILETPKGKIYMVFENTQIKSADPVAYDDAGNVIPLSKRFDAKKSDIRFSFKSTKSGMANDALSAYDEELTRLIGERGDIIVDSYDKLVDIVDLAFDDTNRKATAYFGIIAPETLAKIKNSVSNLPKEFEDTLFKAEKDYSIAATLDSIRHLVDDKNLDRADVVDYVDRLADTIVDADSVSFDYYTKGNNRTPGLLFKKAFSDGTIITFDLVSHKKRALSLQTLYMESADYQKKKRSAETLLMQNNAASKTSKTQVGQTSTDSIAQESDSVKRKKSTAQLSLKSPNSSGAAYEISDGQIKKMIANYTRSKTYSKKEADEAIHEILTNTLYSEDEQATLRGKSRDEVVDMLWNGLNGAAPGKRGVVANKVADYIIEHAMLERVLDVGLQMDIELLRILRPYLRKLDLEPLRDEISHRYDDKTKGVYGRWNKPKDKQGLPWF